jgi:hypothetical protein
MKIKLADRLAATVKATGPQTEYFDEALTGLAPTGLALTGLALHGRNHATPKAPARQNSIAGGDWGARYCPKIADSTDRLIGGSLRTGEAGGVGRWR